MARKTAFDRLFRRLADAAPLKRLDRVPFGWSVAIGAVVGLGVTAGLVTAPAIVYSSVAVVVIALAGLVAWSAQPVGIWDKAREATFLKMVEIEGGTFLMGSPESEEGRFDDERLHRVTLSPFEISETTVTKAQYREVMELAEAPGPGGDGHPVTVVSWFDAVDFCNRLSERDGFEPCYRIEDDTVSWSEDAGGYRLPTEAEWEYAARAGSEGRWSFGDDESELERHAWYSSNAGHRSHPVKELEPNDWGLYDMHGNVWEWCWDRYGEYDSERTTDPRGLEASSAFRVLRGGAFRDEPRGLRSAFRFRFLPVLSYRYVGFRCVRRPLRQP